MYRTLITPATLLLICSLAHAAWAEVRLERKFPEDTRSQVKLEVDTQQVLSLAGMDVNTSSTTSMITDVEIGKRGPDGRLQIREKVTSLKNEASLPGGIKITFDSAEPDNKAALPQLEVVMDLYRATLKNTTTKVLDRNNKIQDVSVSQSVVESIDPQFRDQFDTEKLKGAALQDENQFPAEPVSEGDTWERTEVSHLGAGSTLTVEKVYEYTGTVQRDGRTLDRIVATTNSVDLQQGAVAGVAITDSQLDVEQSEAELLFDRQLGAVVMADERLHIKGDLTMSVNGMELPGKIDLKLHMKTSRASAAPSAGQQADYRTWTDSTGNFSVEAAVVGVTGGVVQLKRKSDGKVISVPLSRLSEADQKLLRQQN